MSIKYLAVDSNVELANIYSELWAERGIIVDRVDNMTEGIQKLLHNEYLFIGINSDAVDFLPMLKTMRSITNSPILIATGNYTMEMDVASLENGADLFGRWQENYEGNIVSVLAHINRLSERIKKQKISTEIITHGDILIIKDNHKAFIKDKELRLTKTEMKIFYYLLVNRGNILTHKQIQDYIWYDENNEITPDNLYNIIKRLRNKIRSISNKVEYIETLRDVGYRISTGFGKKL